MIDNKCGTGSRRPMTTHRAPPSTPRARPAIDLRPLAERGTNVEVVIRVSGRHERWLGEVVRGCSAFRSTVELRPHGCQTSIEFDVDMLVEARAFTPRPGRELDTIILLQAQRVGRASR